jgi:hypothetical protein
MFDTRELHQKDRSEHLEALTTPDVLMTLFMSHLCRRLLTREAATIS